MSSRTSTAGPQHLVFDAANTLIHKPDLWKCWEEVLSVHGHRVQIDHLMRCHKLVSEVVAFPDVTDRDFYRRFNSEVLFSLGIDADPGLLSQLFDACSYLPWRAFDDVAALQSVDLPMSVASNFNTKLRDVLEATVPVNFEHVVISEEIGVAKPSSDFYQAALSVIGVPAGKLLYVGDSPKLDVAPADSLGIPTCLIDRVDAYPHASSAAIASLGQLVDLL